MRNRRWAVEQHTEQYITKKVRFFTGHPNVDFPGGHNSKPERDFLICIAAVAKAKLLGCSRGIRKLL